MSTIVRRQQESQFPLQATSISPPFTGYISDISDRDWFALPSLSGMQQISVLPDLAEVIYPVSIAGIPAGTPSLFQETSVSAAIYEEIIDKGVDRRRTLTPSRMLLNNSQDKKI